MPDLTTQQIKLPHQPVFNIQNLTKKSGGTPLIQMVEQRPVRQNRISCSIFSRIRTLCSFAATVNITLSLFSFSRISSGFAGKEINLTNFYGGHGVGI